MQFPTISIGCGQVQGVDAIPVQGQPRRAVAGVAGGGLDLQHAVVGLAHAGVDQAEAFHSLAAGVRAG